MTIDGGIRMPSAPEVAITPAPKRLGKPCATIAGSTIEPIATTVAGDDPEIAANSAQAITAARPRPPYQCPTIEAANAIMRRATPPWVRKLPARMKNGIAMISKLSMPVNSLSATASIGTVVITNRKLNTVSPSAIDTGMPVSISASNRLKMMALFIGPCPSPRTDFRQHLRHVRDHGVAALRYARTPRQPAKSGNTLDRSRAAHTGRQSSGATRDPARPDRSDKVRPRTLHPSYRRQT